MTASEWIGIYSAFAAAILGSVFGGIATYVASYIMGQHQRTDHQKSAALKSYLKVSLIRADIENSLRTLHESYERANLNGLGDVQAWAKVTLKVNEATPIQITPEDLLPFAEIEYFDLFARLVTSGMQHKAHCDSNNSYARLRLELRSHATANDIVDDIISSDPSQFPQETQLRMLELNSLISSQLLLLPKFSKETAETANLIADVLLKKHKLEVKKFVFSSELTNPG